MVNRQEFEAVVEKIVGEQFPEEMLAFQLSKESLVDEALSKGGLMQSKTAAEMQYLDPDFTKTVLEFVGMLTATAGLLKTAYEARKAATPTPSAAESAKDNSSTLTPQELLPKWKSLLIQEGLPEYKAEVIASAYLYDVYGLIQARS